MASQVAGIVTGLGFESGQDVDVGAKLVQLDISVEQADLASAQATLLEANVAFKRQSDLLNKAVTSEANVDTARAKRDTAEAALNRIKALIGQKSILAPFAGRLGIRHVELGQYISPGLAMVSLQALDPIWVDFPMPEQNVGKLSVGEKIELSVDAFPGKMFTGSVTSLDARVSQGDAHAADPRHAAQSRAHAGSRHVRQCAGGYWRGSPSRWSPFRRPPSPIQLYGDNVFWWDRHQGERQGRQGRRRTMVIDRRFVKPGAVREGRVAIASGLKEGDKVVTAGRTR